MKSAVIKDGLAIQLEVPGESLCQGASARVIFTVTNHTTSPVSLGAPVVSIATAALKDVRAKDPSAFTALESIPFGEVGQVAPGAKVAVEGSYVLPLNGPVSEKNDGVYLLYSPSAETPISEMGQLLLTIVPHPHIGAWLTTLESTFNFVPRGVTWKKGRTSGKFKAPESRRFSLLDELSVGFEFVDGAALQIEYVFNVRRFDMTGQSMAVKKNKETFAHTIGPSDYLLDGRLIDQEGVERSINAALAVVETPLLEG
jgi:hypothetical protein